MNEIIKADLPKPMVEIIPITGNFHIMINGVGYGYGELSQHTMTIWNNKNRMVFLEEEMRVGYRERLLQKGIEALIDDFHNSHEDNK